MNKSNTALDLEVAVGAIRSKLACASFVLEHGRAAGADTYYQHLEFHAAETVRECVEALGAVQADIQKLDCARKRMHADLIVVIGIIAGNSESTSPSTFAAAGSGPPAANTARNAEFETKKAAYIAMLQLKNAMRNPDSFELSSAIEMKDKTICYKYRAQNGFGGMNVEHAVLTNKGRLLAGDSDARIDAWNKSCANKTGVSLEDDFATFRRLSSGND